MTEHQLIQGCRANDRNTQRLLYERYKRAMFTLAYRVTGDWAAAEEVLQDAFMQVFKHLADFEGRSTLGAWIKTIVVRMAISHARRSKPRFEPIEFHPANEELDWGYSPMDVEYLERAIQQLSEGYRMVFVLAEIEGLPHKEIGEMLGISEGTSKSQLFYAKKRLREMLAVMV